MGGPDRVSWRGASESDWFSLSSALITPVTSPSIYKVNWSCGHAPSFTHHVTRWASRILFSFPEFLRPSDGWWRPGGGEVWDYWLDPTPSGARNLETLLPDYPPAPRAKEQTQGRFFEKQFRNVEPVPKWIRIVSGFFSGAHPFSLSLTI